MSEFYKEDTLKQAKIKRKMGLINEEQYNAVLKAYEMKGEDIKTKYEENPELYFRDNASKISDNIESIKKNVQFFFWITMISLIISFLGLIIVLTES